LAAKAKVKVARIASAEPHRTWQAMAAKGGCEPGDRKRRFLRKRKESNGEMR